MGFEASLTDAMDTCRLAGEGEASRAGGHCKLEHDETVDESITETGIDDFVLGTVEAQLRIVIDGVKNIFININFMGLVEI